MRTNYGNLSDISDSELYDIMSMPYTIPKCGGISEVAKRKLKSKKIIDRLKELQQDDAIFVADSAVSDFANAALDILGIEKYTGNREQTKQLISAGLVF